MPFTRFDRYVDRHARSFTERLQALCRMPSVAARGTGMRAVAESVEQMMQRVGIGTRSFRIGNGYPIIYGECGSGSQSFVVYGHYDVQPVGHLSEWSVGPFAATIIDGKLFARGAANSKGDLVARVAAVEAYQKTFGKLPVSLRFLVDGEDGLGSPSLYRFAAENPELLAAQGCVWDEGYKDTKERPVISLGFKGIQFLELRAHGARTDLHSKWGAIVPNPAWRLVQALATITSPKGVITIDGFSSCIAPISAEDTEALKAIELDEAGLKREFRIAGWIRSMKGPALVKEHIFGPTCTICGIHTGHTEAGVKTVLPSTAMARLGLTLHPEKTRVVDLRRAALEALGRAALCAVSRISRSTNSVVLRWRSHLQVRWWHVQLSAPLPKCMAARPWFIRWIHRVALSARFAEPLHRRHRLRPSESVMQDQTRTGRMRIFA